MSEPQARQPGIRDRLHLIALLPALGIGLLLMKSILESDNPVTTLAWFELLLYLLVPLLIGIGVTWFVMRKRRSSRGKALGVVVIIAPYLLLFIRSQLSIAECNQANHEFICGEWSAIIYGIWFAMSVANVLAVVGVGNLLALRDSVAP